VQIAAESGHEWPEASRTRMLSGLEAFATGRIVRGSAVPAADLTIRKLAAIEALARHGRARGAMLDSLSIDPALWPTSALIDWMGILKRVNDVPRRSERLTEAYGLLRARLNFQGTVMTFSTERSDALWWLMVSGDVNANRALLSVMDAPEWREDIGRLVRGALSRQKRGRWNTTVANAWGATALARFGEQFEKVPASGNATITMAGKALPVKVEARTETRDIDWPAGREVVKLTHSGAGAPWAIVQSRAALPLKAPVSTGFAVKRTITPVEQKDRSTYSRGDVYRVTLEVDAQSDMTWVVVDDPIPSGALILGSGLGRDAASLTQGEKREGWAWPAFIERTHEAYRAYYAFVAKGRFKAEYTVRLNNPGRFELPATRVEALYAPEMFAELPNAPLAVKP
jgi:alpha-2-macroglobulin